MMSLETWLLIDGDLQTGEGRDGQQTSACGLLFKFTFMVQVPHTKFATSLTHTQHRQKQKACFPELALGFALASALLWTPRRFCLDPTMASDARSGVQIYISIMTLPKGNLLFRAA